MTAATASTTSEGQTAAAAAVNELTTDEFAEQASSLLEADKIRFVLLPVT